MPTRGRIKTRAAYFDSRRIGRSPLHKIRASLIEHHDFLAERQHHGGDALEMISQLLKFLR